MIVKHIGQVFDHKPNQFVKWHNRDNERNFQKQLKDSKETDKERLDDSWGYQFNSNGFRGEEYDETATKRIAVVGCSYTFGEGLKYENTWPYYFKQLYRDKFKDENVNLLNFAQGGASNDYILRTSIIECEAVKPDVLIVKFSFCDRKEKYSKNLTKMIGPWTEDEDTISFYSFYNPLDGLLNACNNILLLQYYCEVNNIQYMFSFIENWHFVLEDYRYDVNHPIMEIYNKIDKKHLVEYAIEYPEIKCDLARDGLHPGKKSHKIFAERLFKDYVKAYP